MRIFLLLSVWPGFVSLVGFWKFTLLLALGFPCASPGLGGLLPGAGSGLTSGTCISGTRLPSLCPVGSQAPGSRSSSVSPSCSPPPSCLQSRLPCCVPGDHLDFIFRMSYGVFISSIISSSCPYFDFFNSILILFWDLSSYLSEGIRVFLAYVFLCSMQCLFPVGFFCSVILVSLFHVGGCPGTC